MNLMPKPRTLEPAKKHRPSAFVCPGCPGEPLLFVTSTRRLPNGTIVRYRTCTVCGTTGKTVERFYPAK